MAILSAMVASLSTFYPEPRRRGASISNIIRLLAKVPTIAAFSYKKSIGQPFVYPRNDLDYCAELPAHDVRGAGRAVRGRRRCSRKALNLLLILHADHEQNCSTSTVRMVGSSQANLFASISAGICALWGPLHGGANQKVIEMLRDDPRRRRRLPEVRRAWPRTRTSGFRLMGFGHRVYKNFDPRAQHPQEGRPTRCSTSSASTTRCSRSPRTSRRSRSHDDYFVERKLYPNVDFYSGIIYRAMGIPTDMFTVMFALGRLPGWIAQWKEMREDPKGRINRPRQIYIGATKRPYVPIEKRDALVGKATPELVTA